MSSVDTTEQRKPPILRLPAELLDQVSSFLTIRKDVGACRLVCKKLHEVSSPYLITRVVYANRVATINRLYDVLEHPYFHKHVIELVYDASKYRYHEAKDCGAYGQAMKDSERLLDRATVLLQRIFRNASTDLEREHARDRSKVLRSYGWVHPGFRHVGYPDYNRLYSEQESLLERGSDKLIIKQVLKGFPRLKRLTFGDFRCLALEGEDYGICCDRLFGQVLQPAHLDLGNRQGQDALRSLMDQLQVSQVDLRHLVIGEHQWTVTAGDYSSATGRMYEDVIAMPLGVAQNHATAKDYACLSKCRSLSLPVAAYLEPAARKRMSNEALHSSLPRMILSSASASLRNLELGAVDIINPPTGVDRFVNNSGAAESCFLTALLFSIRFPTLERLALRGWVIESSKFSEFLSPMRDHLQELCLEYNVMHGDPEQLARSCGLQLSLSGVEIRNYELKHVNYNDRPDRNLLCETWWLNGRPNAIPFCVAQEEADIEESSESEDGEESSESEDGEESPGIVA